MIDLDGHRPIDINGNERPDLDTRVTQKPKGVAENDHTPGAFYGNGTAAESSGCATYPTSPRCAGLVPADPADRPVIFTPEEQALNRELGLALCSWIPLAGVACDAYDAKRTYEADGLLSWQMLAAGVGFLPLGDLAKLPKQAGNVKDAYKLTKTGPRMLPAGAWGKKVVDAQAKLPSSWGPGAPNKKGVGTRWFDPASKGNGVRIDQGLPGSPQVSQQVDHVVVRSGGNVIGPDGKPIVGPLSQNPQAHIPLSDWMTWSTWNAP